MVVDCKEIPEEIRKIVAHVAAIGEEPRRASDAIAYAVEEISCLRLPTGQLKTLRWLVARLIAYRLARMGEKGGVAKKHLKQYNVLRSKLVGGGVSEKWISELSSGITRRLSEEWGA